MSALSSSSSLFPTSAFQYGIYGGKPRKLLLDLSPGASGGGGGGGVGGGGKKPVPFLVAPGLFGAVVPLTLPPSHPSQQLSSHQKRKARDTKDARGWSIGELLLFGGLDGDESSNEHTGRAWIGGVDEFSVAGRGEEAIGVDSRIGDMSGLGRNDVGGCGEMRSAIARSKSWSRKEKGKERGKEDDLPSLPTPPKSFTEGEDEDEEEVVERRKSISLDSNTSTRDELILLVRDFRRYRV